MLMLASAAMNAFAFAADATGWMVYPAVMFGVAIPALIYSLTNITTELYLGHR